MMNATADELMAENADDTTEAKGPAPEAGPPTVNEDTEAWVLSAIRTAVRVCALSQEARPGSGINGRICLAAAEAAIHAAADEVVRVMGKTPSYVNIRMV